MELELEPLATGTIQVSLYLCNPGKHLDSLTFYIENADDVVIKLLSFGVGTSILCEPELPEELHLGILLTHRKFVYPVKFTNKGFRTHKMKWGNQKSGKVPKNLEDLPVPE